MVCLYELRNVLILYCAVLNIWELVLTEARYMSNQIEPEQRITTRNTPRMIAEDISTRLFDKYIFNEDYDQIDLMLLLDSSVSVGENNFDIGKAFLSCLVSMMPLNDFKTGRIRSAMYSFSNSVNITREFRFGSIKLREMVRRRVVGATYHNGTSTDLSNALLWVDSIFNTQSRPFAKRILIIATDGNSTDSANIPPSLSQIVSAIRGNDADIFIAGLGMNINWQTLSTLSSADTAKISHLKDFQTMSRIIYRLANILES